MDSSFVLRSHLGNFELTPDPDCMMVYVERQKHQSAKQIRLSQVPSWYFDPETIWFFFEASESEDKATAGEKIKTGLLEEAIGVRD